MFKYCQIIFFTVLLCKSPIIINETDACIVEDDKALFTAINGCSRIFSDAPCLKTFIKKEKLTYWAICGKFNLGE